MAEVRYPIEYLEGMVPTEPNWKAAAATKRSSVIDQPLAFPIRGLSTSLRRLIQEGPPEGSDRSAKDFYVCCELLRYGFSEDDIIAVYEDSSNAIGEKFREKGNYGRDYLHRTISKAAQTLPWNRWEALYRQMLESKDPVDVYQEATIVALAGLSTMEYEQAMLMVERVFPKLKFRKKLELEVVKIRKQVQTHTNVARRIKDQLPDAPVDANAVVPSICTLNDNGVQATDRHGIEHTVFPYVVVIKEKRRTEDGRRTNGCL